MNAVIEINNLHKSYGKSPALNGLNFEIEAGVLGLLGPNGAGKTTLLKILLGLIKPNKGFVKIFGYDFATQSLKIRKSLGYLGEDQRFYEYMTGEEYLKFIGLLKGLEKKELKLQIKTLLKKVDLSESGRIKIKNTPRE